MIRCFCQSKNHQRGHIFHTDFRYLACLASPVEKLMLCWTCRVSCAWSALTRIDLLTFRVARSLTIWTLKDHSPLSESEQSCSTGSALTLPGIIFSRNFFSSHLWINLNRQRAWVDVKKAASPGFAALICLKVGDLLPLYVCVSLWFHH